MQVLDCQIAGGAPAHRYGSIWHTSTNLPMFSSTDKSYSAVEDGEPYILVLLRIATM
jgi:hypothetical protein